MLWEKLFRTCSHMDGIDMNNVLKLFPQDSYLHAAHALY